MNTTANNKANGLGFDKSFGNFIETIFNDFPNNIKGEAYQHGFKGFAPVNIFEKDNSFFIDIIAPGFSKENFKIDIVDNILSVEALPIIEAGTENGNTHKIIKQQYTLQPFKRSFTIDNKIDTDAIQAEYVNGILKITLHKKEEARLASKQIEVR